MCLHGVSSLEAIAVTQISRSIVPFILSVCLNPKIDTVIMGFPVLSEVYWVVMSSLSIDTVPNPMTLGVVQKTV
jgi:hypothetical protein